MVGDMLPSNLHKLSTQVLLKEMRETNDRTSSSDEHLPCKQSKSSLAQTGMIPEMQGKININERLAEHNP